MKLGTRIKNIRESKGLTRNELAAKIGVTDVSISRYENNKREPKIETLKKIADTLDIPLTDLISNDLDKITKEYLFQDDLLNTHIRSLQHYLDDKLLKDSEKAVLKNFTNDFLSEYTEMIKSLISIERIWDNSYKEYSLSSSLSESELKILFLRENLNNYINNISDKINNFPGYIVHNEIKENNDNLSSDMNK